MTQLGCTATQYTHIHRWPSAWLQHLQFASNGDTADPHINTYIPNICMYCKHINSYKYLHQSSECRSHARYSMVYIEEAMLSDIGGHICLPDLATGCVYTRKFIKLVLCWNISHRHCVFTLIWFTSPGYLSSVDRSDIKVQHSHGLRLGISKIDSLWTL